MEDDVTQGELTRWLTRVEAKMDKITGDHERRLRRLEVVLYVGIGASAALGSGVGSVLGRVIGG